MLKKKQDQKDNEQDKELLLTRSHGGIGNTEQLGFMNVRLGLGMQEDKKK